MIFFSLIALISASALHSIKSKISPVIFGRITSISLIYSALLTLNTFYIQSIGSGLGIYSGLFFINNITQNIEIFIYLLASFILVAIYSPNYNLELNTLKISNIKSNLKINHDWKSEYPLIILFSILGASCLISSSDLISMYLSIELQSFSVYILSTLNRGSITSTSAGLKYFLLGGLSSCIILLGVGFIYMSFGLTQFEGIFTLLSTANVNINNYNLVDTLISSSLLNNLSSDLLFNNSIQGFTLGLILIIIGLLFKISAAPFYNWAPDVYDGVPTTVTTWLTIMPKISLIIFLLELFLNQSLFIFNMNSNFADFFNGDISRDLNLDIFKNLLLLSSLLSLIIGSVLGLVQTRIKRLFAYSTIGHVGFLLLALSINSAQSVESFIFYLIQYSLTNLNLFLIILAFGYYFFYNSKVKVNKNTNQDIELLSDLKEQLSLNPILSLSLAICLFSMAGIPPLVGFFGKYLVLYSAIENGYFFMSFIGIIVSVISAYYYLKLINIVHFSVPVVTNSKSNEVNKIKIINHNFLNNSHSFLIAILTLFVFLFWINPLWLSNSIRIIVLTLFFI